MLFNRNVTHRCIEPTPLRKTVARISLFAWVMVAFDTMIIPQSGRKNWNLAEFYLMVNMFLKKFCNFHTLFTRKLQSVLMAVSHLLPLGFVKTWQQFLILNSTKTWNIDRERMELLRLRTAISPTLEPIFGL